MASVVMAYIVMACIKAEGKVMACVVVAYIVLACIKAEGKVMACVVVAYTVFFHASKLRGKSGPV